MEEVKEKEAETTEEFEAARKKVTLLIFAFILLFFQARRIRALFEKVKTDRYRRFQECFEPVAQKIDEIYKVHINLFDRLHVYL